ncbi:MAG: phosphatase PAP2 family protein [Candidatus Aureabacteria bacterium]|nr:phosphatase PAP2 family protein [Candidatus Auribacterota bacterium]
MKQVSRSADGYIYPFIVILLFLLSWSQLHAFFLSFLVAFAFEIVAYKIIKKTLKRNRPCEEFPHVQMRLFPPDKFSFPSGHTAGAFCMATLLLTYYPILSIPVLTWAAMVGLSRIYLGLHYPSDVLAGIVLGSLSAYAGLVLMN